MLRDLVPFLSLEDVRNTHGAVLLLVTLQTLICNFTLSIIPPWVFSRFLNHTNSSKLRKPSHMFDAES